MSMATPRVVLGNDTSAGRWVTVTVIVLSTFVAQSFARFSVRVSGVITARRMWHLPHGSISSSIMRATLSKVCKRF